MTTASPADADAEVDVYRLKRVRYGDKLVPIVCQNANGPCPLIAICNVLLLRGAIALPPSSRDLTTGGVTFGQLSNVVANHLVEANTTKADNAHVLSNINDVIGLLPTLQFGLDVNVRFNAVTSFEFTQNQLVFDLLNIRLVHGWLLDPQDTATAEAIGASSYNVLVERVIQYQEQRDRPPSPPPPEGEEEPPDAREQRERFLREGRIIDEFLKSTAGQLTYHGLHELHTQVRPGELCVLFRNNHFSTLLHHQGSLYVLVTDVGYAATALVWERLASIDGDNDFVDAEFRVPRPPSTTPPPGPGAPFDPNVQEEADRLLALRLCDEDRRATEAAASSAPASAASGPPDARDQRQILEQIQKRAATPPPRTLAPDGHRRAQAKPRPPQGTRTQQARPEKSKECSAM